MCRPFLAWICVVAFHNAGSEVVVDFDGTRVGVGSGVDSDGAIMIAFAGAFAGAVAGVSVGVDANSKKKSIYQKKLTLNTIWNNINDGLVVVDFVVSELKSKYN